MKTSPLLLLLFLLILALPTSAQEQTLVGSGELEHGGFGAVVAKATTINGQASILVGGRGGWIINHTISIGGGGYGLVNDVRADVSGPFGQNYLNLGYGGLDIEYIINSDDLIHASIHALFGGGGVGFRYGAWEDTDYWDTMWGHDFSAPHEMDQFFVVEPGATVDLNVAPWFRLSGGVTYRHVLGVSSRATTNERLSGVSGVVMFRFGKF